jgi:hypothetical protein
MWLVILAFTLWGVREAGDEPPVIGRPSHFTGAVGIFTSVEASAKPTVLEVGQPLIFTVRIMAPDTPRRPPSRPDIRRLPEFTKRFLIEDLPEANRSSTEWEYRYILRPLDESVAEIPAVRFDYYRPGIVPAEKGYQTRYSEPIALTVHALQPLLTVESEVGGPIPPSLYELAEDAEILRRDQPYGVPWIPLLVAALGPPFIIGSLCYWKGQASPLVLAAMVMLRYTAAEPSDSELLERGIESFRAGLTARAAGGAADDYFAQAAADFRTLRHRGYQSAPLLRNEGNAWLWAGDLPNAILAYRRGLRFEPGEPALRENLAYARRLAHPDGYGRAYPEVPPAAGPVLAWAAILLYTVAVALLGYWWISRRRALLTSAGLALLGALVAVAGLWLYQRQLDREAHPIAVVTHDGTELHSGDGNLYPLRREEPLFRGEELRLVFIRGDWLQVETADNTVGWVPARFVLTETD